MPGSSALALVMHITGFGSFSGYKPVRDKDLLLPEEDTAVESKAHSLMNPFLFLTSDICPQPPAPPALCIPSPNPALSFPFTLRRPPLSTLPAGEAYRLLPAATRSSLPSEGLSLLQSSPSLVPGGPCLSFVSSASPSVMQQNPVSIQLVPGTQFPPREPRLFHSQPR